MGSTTSKNLGQVSATITSATAPTNLNVIWLDISDPLKTVKKVYNPAISGWEPLTQAATLQGDDWGGQVVVPDDSLKGDGTEAKPLGINQQGATTGQVLKWDGDSWSPADDEVGSGLENVTTSSEFQGDGTVTSRLKLAPGTAVNQVLKWNGTQWVPGVDQIGAVFERQMIVMWSGAITAIPSGWALCDGNNGKVINGITIPDLRGRMAVQVDGRDVSFSQIGKIGGAKTVTLSVAQMPAHNHGVVDNGHTHSMNRPRTDTVGQQYEPNTMKNDNDRGLWTGDTVSTGSAKTGITIGNTGGGQPHENMSPFFVLAFIIRVA